MRLRGFRIDLKMVRTNSSKGSRGEMMKRENDKEIEDQASRKVNGSLRYLMDYSIYKVTNFVQT